MIGVFAALAAFAIDQITKAIVVANAVTLSAGISVFPGFNLVFYRNDGVTFGMLGGAPLWSLIALALAICVWLGVMLIRAENAVETLAYGAIIGGALGNVIDRVRYRAVTDFLDFYIGTTHWPAFNMADVFVVSGVGLLLAAPWISARRPIKS
ncbi:MULTISPECIES: signal peptidase II [Roseovarius]|uniref:Lipoprotein signal peptidase n=1 Tax=Roseovarius nubinhibens (strain ATCC BAA-591 / DSM 15170 / ISM) TaxID=89187 RepID=A3SRW1_ROSNI|nr:signal peptidase II [Roseovarius nubinhibens]EAP74992.1 lipoprotein signal peptidase [Roseovarius nubinhibens ISM]